MAKKGTILLSVTGFDPAVWRSELQQAAPDRRVVEEPSRPGDPDIEYAVVWKQRPGVLSSLPNLKAIFSIGAGVDHIFADGTMPDVPVVRVVADDLTERMSEYVVWQVLDHHRKGPLYRGQQARRFWHEDQMQPAAREVTVGILGYGNLGRDAAVKLRGLGFEVIGWSRTAKAGETIDTFAGEAGLGAFLTLSDIVVCLLPLTPATRGILSAPFFAGMKTRGPLGAPILIPRSACRNAARYGRLRRQGLTRDRHGGAVGVQRLSASS
jgi:glyoxylate/hydroxypyruvate reductase A